MGYPKQGVLGVVRRVLRFVEGGLRLFKGFSKVVLRFVEGV